MKKLMIILAAALMPVSFSMEAFASSFADTYGFSTRGMARGNAMCAIVDDWSSVYYNLAGLGKTPPRPYAKGGGSGATKSILEEESDTGGGGGSGELRNEIGLNYLYAQPNFAINFTEEYAVVTKADQDLELTGFSFAMVFDINTWYEVPEKYVSSIRFGFGIAMPGDGQMIKLNDIDLRTHDFLRYGREAERIVILAGIGLGFMDDMFGIGLGSNILMSGEGRMVMSGMEIGPGEQTPDYQAKMDMGPDPSPAAGLYWEIGDFLKIFDIKNKWTEDIRWGAAYRGEVAIEIDPFAALGGTEIAAIELPMTLAMYEYYTPNIITTGVAYGAPIPVPGMKDMYGILSIDYEFQQWSRNQISSAREKTFDQAGVDLPEFQDIHCFKLGLGVDILKWLSASLGYYYQPSYVPAEANEGIFNFLDNDKNVVSGGVDFIVPPMYGMKNPLNVSLACQYQMLTERTVKKDHARADAEADAMGWDYDPTYNPSYTYGGNNILVTLEIGLKW